MSVKLLMSWDVVPGRESEYFEFVVNEFIPKISQLGISDIQLWYTSYGNCEQILASGVTETSAEMKSLIGSDDWRQLNEKLHELVTDFSQKLVPAARGFQL